MVAYAQNVEICFLLEYDPRNLELHGSSYYIVWSYHIRLGCCNTQDSIEIVARLYSLALEVVDIVQLGGPREVLDF